MKKPESEITMKRPQVKSFRPLLWLTIPALLGLAWLGGTLALLSDPITPGAVPSAHAAGDPRYYDIGSPTLTEVWVDPVNGNNNNTGNSRLRLSRPSMKLGCVFPKASP